MWRRRSFHGTSRSSPPRGNRALRLARGIRAGSIVINGHAALQATWIIDLDDTLYRPECGLVSQIQDRSRQFVREHLGISIEEADALRHQYMTAYGTTLFGLMKHDGVKAEQFLEFVHNLDLSVVQPWPGLAEALKELPGRRIIFTNGPMRHAGRVLEAAGLTGVFDAVFDIEAANYVPKPARETYDRLIERFSLGKSAAMFEDRSGNLLHAHALGMLCVLVGPAGRQLPPHVQFHAPELPLFVRQVGQVLRAKQAG